MEKLLIFSQKPWTNPFGKMQIFGVFLIDFSTTQIKLLFVLKYHTTLFIALVFIKTKDGKRLTFFNKGYGLTPLGKCKFLGLFYIEVFYSQIKALFVLQLFKTLFIDPFSIKTKDGKKFSILTKNMV